MKFNVFLARSIVPPISGRNLLPPASLYPTVSLEDMIIIDSSPLRHSILLALRCLVSIRLLLVSADNCQRGTGVMEYWSTGILGFQTWNTTLETLIATFSRSPLGRHASLSWGTGQVVQTVNSASECSEGERQFASCHPH